jgi:hypothetical protein
MKSSLVGAELFFVDGQTDGRKETNCRFSQFCGRVWRLICNAHFFYNMDFSMTLFNPLTPNDHYSGRTASLTSKCCILHIYSTNIIIAYFKHDVHCPFFSFKIQFVS